MPARDEGFDRGSYRPPAGTHNYVFAFVPKPAFPAGADCAVQIESKAYLDATGGTCADHWIGERLDNLPTYMVETAPGLFTSTASETFTRLLLSGLGMRESADLLAAATPRPRGSRARPASVAGWSDPVDRHLDPHLRRAEDPNLRRAAPAFAMKPSTDARDYYYAAMPDPDTASEDRPLVVVYLVRREFFDEFGIMQGDDLDVRGLPSHLRPATGDTFRSERDIMQVCLDLESIGMSATRHLTDTLNEDFEAPTPSPGR